jgi:hypothetical protein
MGLAIIIAVPRLTTIIAGLGLIGLSVMVFVFNKILLPLPGMTARELSSEEEEQPKLLLLYDS